jgi:hypothetical protein
MVDWYRGYGATTPCAPRPWASWPFVRRHLVSSVISRGASCQATPQTFRRKACWGFFARKIRRLRPGANPRSWVPEASILTTRPHVYLWQYLAKFFMNEHFFRQNGTENSTFSAPIFPKSRCLWDNIEKYGTARQDTGDNMIRRKRIARWVLKATYTHSEYVVLIEGFTNTPHCYVI